MTAIREYDRRMAEIFERHQSVQSKGFTGSAYKPGLEAIENFCAFLGNPQYRFRSVHVAGTNGKGSVSSMLASALAATGRRVGLYTSPHLLDFRERMKLICGNSCSMISREEVMEFLDKCKDASEGLSFFELTTGMAFWWFARQNVDVAVIEVGLGGRLDSTNIIKPELSVVTSIGLDHCAILGSTRTAIAGEKAGIFKKDVPALVWGHDPETDGVFIEHAATVNAPLHFADEFMPELPDASSLDLQGPCQDANLRTVLAGLDILGVQPDMDAIANTAAITVLRGRWERLCTSPEVICDIGHNPPALVHNFGRLRNIVSTGRQLVIVYGIMADKDLAGIAPLMPSEATYLLAAPATQRAMPAGELLERLHGLRPDLSLSTASSVKDAVSQALAMAGSDALIYIGGSTFVVAEALELFDNTL